MTQMLHDYFADKSIELLSRYKTSGHQNSSDNRGKNRENFLNMFLKNTLPARLKITSGEIFDKDMKKSGQLETILIRDDCPALDFEGENSYFIGGVFGIIEVKSDLKTGQSGTLKKALVGLKKVSALKYPSVRMLIGNLGEIPLPLKVIFAYKSSCTLSTIEEFAKKNGYEDCYDLICVLDRGAVIGKSLQKNFWEQFILKKVNIGDSVSNIIESKSISLGLLFYYFTEYGSTFLFGSSSMESFFSDIIHWD